MSSNRATIGTVFKLAIACLIVGWLLSLLGYTPQELVAKISAAGLGLWAWAGDFLGWGGAYMLLGALVVLPIWLAMFAWRKLRAK